MTEKWDKPHAPRPDRDGSPYPDTRLGFIRWLTRDLAHLAVEYVRKPLVCKLKGHIITYPDKWENVNGQECERCGAVGLQGDWL